MLITINIHKHSSTESRKVWPIDLIKRKLKHRKTALEKRKNRATLFEENSFLNSQFHQKSVASIAILSTNHNETPILPQILPAIPPHMSFSLTPKKIQLTKNIPLNCTENSH
jgi:hypothetical protein